MSPEGALILLQQSYHGPSSCWCVQGWKAECWESSLAEVVSTYWIGGIDYCRPLGVAHFVVATTHSLSVPHRQWTSIFNSVRSCMSWQHFSSPTLALVVVVVLCTGRVSGGAPLVGVVGGTNGRSFSLPSCNWPSATIGFSSI